MCSFGKAHVQPALPSSATVALRSPLRSVLCVGGHMQSRGGHVLRPWLPSSLSAQRRGMQCPTPYSSTELGSCSGASRPSPPNSALSAAGSSSAWCLQVCPPAGLAPPTPRWHAMGSASPSLPTLCCNGVMLKRMCVCVCRWAADRGLPLHPVPVGGSKRKHPDGRHLLPCRGAS